MKPAINNAFVCLLTASSCMIAAAGCSPDPGKRLDASIESYRQKKPGAEANLAADFLGAVSVDSIPGSNVKTTGALLYAVAEPDLEIVYPEKISLSSVDDAPLQAVDRTKDYAVASDGIHLSIFNASGSHLHDQTAGDVKNPVRSLIIDGDDVIYYKDSNLYRYSILHKTGEKMSGDAFPPPFRSYYAVSLCAFKDLLGICAGMAGSYSFSIVNRTTGAVVLKNLVLSSSKYCVSGGAVYYVSGNAGNWELMRYDVDNKTKRSLARFADIVDIDLGALGFLCESKQGLWTAEYGKDGTPVPFPFKPGGVYKGRLLIHYLNRYYFIDMRKFIDHLNAMKKALPDLFAAGSQQRH